MTQLTPSDRVRAFGYFIIAVIYFFIAEFAAARAANGFSSGEWSQLIERTILLFLLLAGYGAMGRAFQRQQHPIKTMGLVFRPGWPREFGLGAALGWGMLIASILPTVLIGGLIVSVWTVPRQFGILLLDVLVLAVASLAEEVAFRGYPFQRLIEAVGPFLATLVLSFFFGAVHLFNPGATRATIMITMFSGWLLCAAYLRTRALWFSWGWHFAWNASMGLIFGLPISGLTRFSPVIQSNTVGPVWLTGGDYGPEGSLVTAIIILLGIIAVFKTTRSYAYKYAQPVIVAGGMPVDLDAMNRVVAPHHSAAEAPAGTKLVQIDSISGLSPITLGSGRPEAVVSSDVSSEPHASPNGPLPQATNQPTVPQTAEDPHQANE